MYIHGYCLTRIVDVSLNAALRNKIGCLRHLRVDQIRVGVPAEPAPPTLRGEAAFLFLGSRACHVACSITNVFRPLTRGSGHTQVRWAEPWSHHFTNSCPHHRTADHREGSNPTSMDPVFELGFVDLVQTCRTGPGGRPGHIDVDLNTGAWLDRGH